jgi:hypothetical protein
MAKRKQKLEKLNIRLQACTCYQQGGNNRQSLVSLQVVLKVYKLDGSLSDKRKLFFFAVSWCCSADFLMAKPQLQLALTDSYTETSGKWLCIFNTDKCEIMAIICDSVADETQGYSNLFSSVVRELYKCYVTSIMRLFSISNRLVFVGVLSFNVINIRDCISNAYSARRQTQSSVKKSYMNVEKFDWECFQMRK